MKTLVKLVIYPPLLALGLTWYLLSGKNYYIFHQALVFCFCKSGGQINDWISRIISKFSSPILLPSRSGVLGELNDEKLDSLTKKLATTGYLVFPSALPTETVQSLFNFAMTTKAKIRPMDGEKLAPKHTYALFDPSETKAVRYDYATDELLANSDVQNLLADPTLLAIGERYLQARPRFDVLSMWWHTKFKHTPDSHAAQLYHFDLDRIKWLKVFIYLTDVGPGDGAHSFIEGSHNSGAIPNRFLERGYSRLQDDEVLDYFGSEREITFTAPKGTVIIEDTRGLHKGNVVEANSRLILQLQMSNSLFGAIYPKAKLPAENTDALKAMRQANPDVYSAYV